MSSLVFMAAHARCSRAGAEKRVSTSDSAGLLAHPWPLAAPRRTQPTRTRAQLRARAAAEGAEGVVDRAPSAEVRSALATLGAAMVSDTAVPEGHKGLHGELYGEGDAHAAAREYRALEGEDDGRTLQSVESWLRAREGAKVPGVYAVYDSARSLQLVSYSRNVVLSLRTHLAAQGEQLCASVRVKVFAAQAVTSRANLEAEANSWLLAAGAPPPGNAADAARWGAGTVVMSASERAGYEELKLKMRRAMGDKGVLVPDDGQDSVSGDAAQRRLDMISAMERDDWSTVIDGQTREVLGEDAAAPAAAASDYVVSPFTRSDVHRAVGRVAQAPRAISVAAVHESLEEVRPYLIADGGNVEVLAVDNGIVSLRLQGACGTCSSSAATMKMGVERAIRSTFGDAVKDIILLPSAAGSAIITDLAAIRALLADSVGASVIAMGGRVEARSLERGVCVLGFKGPLPLGQALAASVKNKFHDLRDVRIEEL